MTFAVRFPSGGCAVPVYRFYIFEINGCVAVPPTIYELPNDAAALKEAEKILDDRTIEIWRRARKIGCLNPPS